MLKSKLAQFRSALVAIAFGAMFLLLPISSSPLLSKLVGGTSVAPLSALPALLLVVILVIPTIFKKQLFSKQFQPLLIFFLIALLSTLLMLFRQVPSFRDYQHLKNTISSFITLLMGFAFYYLCAHYLNSEAKFGFVLRWMNIGALILIAYSFVQALYMKTPIEIYPDWLWRLTRFFVSNGTAFRDRISGMAFEPSWLAHMLNLLYIPLWLGFSIKGYSVYKARIFKKFTVENVLLLLGLSLLFLSFSRIGWISFLAIIIYLMLKVANILINKVINKFEDKRKRAFSAIQRVLLKLVGWLVVFMIAGVLVISAALLISKLDPKRTASILDIEAIKERGVLGWANLLFIAERFVYWMTGFRVFQLYPWIGVGLGAIGYYFPIAVPGFGYYLPDVVHALNRESFIPNAKNLWARLLAETGIIGTAFFVAWIMTQLKSANELEKHGNSRFLEAVGLAGKLFVIAFIFEGFSMDTFGLPYYWIAFGLLVAAWRIMKTTPVDIAAPQSV